jgi:ribosome-associated protein
MNQTVNDTLELVRICCRVLDDKKAGELTVLDVAEQSSITDYLVLATATSEPHLRALRIELEKTFDAANVKLVGEDAAQESGWVVLDAFDVMVHLFLKAQRENYALERLWRDAVPVDVAALLQPPVAAKPTKSKRTAGGSKRKAAKATGTKAPKRARSRAK